PRRGLGARPCLQRRHPARPHPALCGAPAARRSAGGGRVNALATTERALRGAARDAKRSWNGLAWLAVAGLAVAALLPVVLPGLVQIDRLAETVYLAIAAVGLGFAVGVGGMPSVAQGAFVGIGAVVAAHLAVHGWPVLAPALLAAAAAALGGIVVAAAIVRFRPVYVAAVTWIVTWLFALGLVAFPSISGGAQGVVVPPAWTPTVHYELAVALVALAMLGHRTLAHSSFGLALQEAAQRPGGAAALGTEAASLRLRAFAGAAAVGGLAGGLAVQLAGVADSSVYGPELSFRLLVAVLVGGAASAVGPTVGIVLLGLLALVGDGLADLTGTDTVRLSPMLAALLLLVVLAAGGDGILPELHRRVHRCREAAGAPSLRLAPYEGAKLDVHGLAKRFGGVGALERLALDVRPGGVRALIGPNGSGKTTALRLLAGTMRPDSGRVAPDQPDIAPGAPAPLRRAWAFGSRRGPGTPSSEPPCEGATAERCERSSRRRRHGKSRGKFALERSPPFPSSGSTAHRRTNPARSQGPSSAC